MARSDGIDELDARFPIRLSEPPALYWRLIKHPPVTSKWRSHLGFTVDETARVLAVDAAPVEAFVRPLDSAPVGVPYPELAEAALAHEFPGPGATSGLTLGRSV